MEKLGFIQNFSFVGCHPSGFETRVGTLAFGKLNIEAIPHSIIQSMILGCEFINRGVKEKTRRFRVKILVFILNSSSQLKTNHS